MGATWFTMKPVPPTDSIMDRPAAVKAVHFGYPWQPDGGDGTYRNPVLYADYSDPDVVRVGADFFLTASSFNCTPGLPILHSRDLVNWKLIGHALNNLPGPRYEQCQPGCGVWAPTIRFQAGQFWIFFPMPDEGIFVTTASHPAGPWSEPHLVQAGRGLIDPCPFWDEDGLAYLVHAYAGSRAGIKHRLRVCPMAADGSRLLGGGQVVFDDPDKHPTLEGPKFYKRDGWYYLLAPAGGVETGWQVALRSRFVYGPYEDKIVLAQGGTPVNGPHQGALVDTAGGDSWFVHFQAAGIYGRVTHLQPVVWEAGWPVIGNRGEPVLHHAKPQVAATPGICAPATSDEFAGGPLSLQWQWNANHREEWYSLTARRGWLRLYLPPAGALKELPNWLLQKFPARDFRVESLLDCSGLPEGGEGGLMVAGRSSAAWCVRRQNGKLGLWLRRNQKETAIGAPLAERVRLRVTVRDGGGCEFSFADGGEFAVLSERFTATQGVWIGARVGLYAMGRSSRRINEHLDFDYFRFSPVSGSV